MTLENQLLAFATTELAKAKAALDRFNQRLADDPDSIKDKDGCFVKYDLTHWTEVCALIAKKFALEGDFGPTPIDSSRLTGTMSYWISRAQMEAEHLAVELDSAQSRAETDRIEYRLQHQRACLLKSKQMANFYAFILGINHPYPGVDMLPASIDAAA